MHTLAKMDLVETRLKILNERYIEKCELYCNPIIGELISDYEELKGSGETISSFLTGIEYLNAD